MRTKGYNLTTCINNFHISYDDLGEGATPIIFLHGYPFDKSMWRAQIDFLQGSNRVIAVDLRGFGASKDEVTSLSIGLFADDLIKFMNALCIDKAMICGLSMGGYIALNVVNRFPSRFEALILCDTQCSADTKETKEKRYKSIEEINANGTTTFNENFIKSVFYAGSLLNKKETVEALRSVVFSNSQHIVTAGLIAISERSETCSTLSEIKIPTLIICGREDVLIPLAKAEYMHTSIQDSVLKIINHAGHVCNLEQPQEFNKHVCDFIVSIGGPECVDRKTKAEERKSMRSTAVWDL
jgi:3-oxoadipate enol-lactonase